MDRTERAKSESLSKKKKNDIKKKNQAKALEGQNKSEDAESSDLMEDIKKNKNSIGIVAFLAIFVIITFYLQYQFELNRRKFKGEVDEIDYYEVLGLNEGASSSEIRKAYKDLAKIWHPDKNPGCASCAEKFKLIAKAGDTLMAQASNDSNKLGKSIFSSSPYYLTSNNYHRLVEESNDFWVICVFENQQGNTYNKYIADAFDEVNTKYKSIIKFGVIDALKHQKLLHFLPFKFQFFPNIFTYLHGDSELLGNFDVFSVSTLIKFIENSYITKVQLGDHNYLESASLKYRNENPKIELPKRIDIHTVLEKSIFVLSPKNNIDIVTKDYARIYKEHLDVYQNELGYYDQSLKVFNSKGDYKVFVGLNKVTSQQEGELIKYFSEKVLVPIPIKFSVSSDMTERLQRAFIFTKGLIVPRVYKNNYTRHCVNRLILENELDPSYSESTDTNVTRISICVIVLEHSNDSANPDFEKELIKAISEKFFQRIDESGKPKKSHSSGEEVIIRLNYGIINIDKDKELQSLYLKSKEQESFNLNPKQKHFLFINDTNERFLFKSFSQPQDLSEYLIDIDNSDYFQDINFAFKYFSEFSVNHITDILLEERYFSLIKILTNSFYSLMQATHIITFIILVIANSYVFKVELTKFLIYMFSIAYGLGFFLNIVWSLFF